MTEIDSRENCLQLVLPNSGLLLEDNEFICPDGTRAILVNRHLLQDDTVILQEEDLTHLYVEEENGQILLANGYDCIDYSTEENLDESKIIELVDADTLSNIKEEEPQIVYITEDSLLTQDDSISQFQLMESVEGNEIVESQIVNLEEFVTGNNENVFEYLWDDKEGFQYAVLKDGRIHLPSSTDEFAPIISSEVCQEPASISSAEKRNNNEQIVDISSITGKNLLTGQKVTLHSYMDKIQKQLKNGITPASINRKRKVQTNNLYNLLNKKLNIGKTPEGKRLVGKIVQIRKRNSNNESGTNFNISSSIENGKEEEAEEMQKRDKLITNDIQIVENSKNLEQCNPIKQEETTTDQSIKEHPKDNFQPISKSLEGLMLVKNIRKQLENKNIIIKIVEKPNSSEKHVSYTSGRMRNSVVINSDGTTTKLWNFVADNNMESNFKQNFSNSKGSPDVAHVTLIISYQKENERVIRIILNPTTTKYVCSKCPRVFKSRLQLRIHRNTVHKIVTNKMKDLKISDSSSLPSTMSEESQEAKQIEKKNFQCGLCLQKFVQLALLNKHLKVVHSISPYPYVCEQCGQFYNTLGDLNQHKKSHVPLIKNYQCETCKRSFTRYSNLQRHVAIHEGAEQMFQCSICGCSYHYVSSLTKHIVQNHIQTERQNS